MADTDMTDTDMADTGMADKVIYPQMSGLNWPSTVLHVWLTLRSLGVPEKNLRFLPEIGHFAAPEVTEEDVSQDPERDADGVSWRHPQGPNDLEYDPNTGRAEVSVDVAYPAQWHPRFAVNVRAETVLRFHRDAQGNEVAREHVVGRLSSFMQPMLTGVLGMEPEALEMVVECLIRALGETSIERRKAVARELTEILARQPDLALCKAVFPAMAVALALDGQMDRDIETPKKAFHRFQIWADKVFLQDPGLRIQELEHYVTALSPDDRQGEQALLRQLHAAIAREQHTAKPVPMLTRQVGRCYPEMMATLPANVREVLEKAGEDLGAALAEEDLQRRQRAVRQTVESLYEEGDLKSIAKRLKPAPGVVLMPGRQSVEQHVCKAAFLTMKSKLPTRDIAGLEDASLPDAMGLFQQWAEVLFLADSDSRGSACDRLVEELGEEGAHTQRILWREFLVALKYETSEGREKIVRELMEIVTTEVFTSVAVLDGLWGLGWIHGPISDFRLDTTPARLESLLLSVIGGLNHRTVLTSRMQHWGSRGAFLGVGRLVQAEEGIARECLTMEALDEAEQSELWSLVSWRREAADPLVLLQIAAHRLVHPEITVILKRYVQAAARFGTLFAQPEQKGGLGGTAVLGGKGQMQYPGVVICVPLTEEEDVAAQRAKAVLKILIRLFLPVGLRVEIVWREAVARLGESSYLQHDFQKGVRFADPWAALNEVPDPEIDPALL